MTRPWWRRCCLCSTGPNCRRMPMAAGAWRSARCCLGWRSEVVLVEQPLAACNGDEQGFVALQGAARSLWWRMKVAESGGFAAAGAPRAGVNLKLLKTGGLSEALLMARVASRLGLKLMLGCYSDSALLNGAAAQLLPLVECLIWIPTSTWPMTLCWPCGPGSRSPALALVGGAAMLSPFTGAAAAARRPSDLLAKRGWRFALSPGPCGGRVDPGHAGADLPLLTGIPRPVPVVGSVAEAMVYGPQVAVVGLALRGVFPTGAPIGAGALRSGLSVASGLHTQLAADPELQAAVQPGSWIGICARAGGLGVAAARAARCLAAGSWRWAPTAGWRGVQPWSSPRLHASAGWMPFRWHGSGRDPDRWWRGASMPCGWIAPLAYRACRLAGGRGATEQSLVLWRGRAPFAIQAQQPPCR